MSKVRTNIGLLKLFVIYEQNKILKIDKENALTILKEAESIIYILDQNNKQEVLNDLKNSIILLIQT